MPNFNLKEQLPLLYELQQIDTEILRLHNQLKAIPTLIKKLEDSFQVHRQKLQDKQEQLQNAEKEQRSKTAELEMEQEQRRKYQSQLREVKTNKEYQALDKEIAFIQVKEAEIEDAILEAMLRIDQCKEELNQQQKAFNAEQEKNNARKAEYEKKTEELKAQIVAYQEKRQNLSPKIDSDLVSLYQEWFNRQHRGLVSLTVDNACGSCYMTVPPQTLKEAAKYEQIIRCGSCRCILYVPPAPLDEAPSE